MWLERLTPGQFALIETVLDAIGDDGRGDSPHFRGLGLAWGRRPASNRFFLALLHRAASGIFDDVPPHDWSRIADELLATLSN